MDRRHLQVQPQFHDASFDEGSFDLSNLPFGSLAGDLSWQCGNGGGFAQPLLFNVELSPGSGKNVQIWAEHSTPKHAGPNSKTLLILLSGATYDHRYWDLPGVPGKYSFVDAANKAGFATLNLDRLGLGNSSKPSADQVNLGNEAYTTHEIINQVKAGALGEHYDNVILVGHSIGSGVAVQEAGTYNDVDGVVLTGFTHYAGPNFPLVPAGQVAASTDPNVPPDQQQPGYLTTAVGTRSLFYNTADASQTVIAADEAAKQTVTSGELGDFVKLLGNRAISDAIKAPVLSMFGAQDLIFDDPGGVRQALDEHTWFNGASSYQAVVVPKNPSHNSLASRRTSSMALARTKKPRAASSLPSWSRASLRHRPAWANVRSTTHRRGWTAKPFWSGSALTTVTSMRVAFATRSPA